MPTPITVESALAELREMVAPTKRSPWLRVSVRGTIQGTKGQPSYRAKVNFAGLAFYRDGSDPSLALAQCMAAVRAWKESQQ